MNTAATIADISHKHALTRQIGAETAHAHMDALGQAAMLGQAPLPPLQHASIVPRVPLQGQQPGL